MVLSLPATFSPHFRGTLVPGVIDVGQFVGQGFHLLFQPGTRVRRLGVWLS